MAIVTVYNRNGTKYGTLNTDNYIFKNFSSSFGMAFFDKNYYPYVKIDNTYYINDGDS
jgi:hypothetical protein